MTKHKQNYVTRDISWLAFNDRVLQEANDPDVPLIERIKFLGIFSNNLDEFFRVRVAVLKRTIEDPEMGEKDRADATNLMESITDRVIVLQNRFDNTFIQLEKELEQKNIFIVNEQQLNKQQQAFVKSYFAEMVRPCLVPIMLNSSPTFPYLKDRAIYLAIKLIQHTDITASEVQYSVIEIPTDVRPRFVQLPDVGAKKYIILLDDVIRFCLQEIYAIFNYSNVEAYTIKITRDAELDLNNDNSKSYTEKLLQSVKQRKKGKPVRLNYDSEIPQDLLNYIVKKLKMKDESNLIPGGRYHNFRNFIKFPSIGSADLQYNALKPLPHPEFHNQVSLLNVIQKKDVLLYFPYQSYQYIVDILREAAIDPTVESIKITLYRISENSNIAYTLLNAIKNGKKVTAIIELQARFDEENNMYWANKLQEEGANVKFGIPGLKIHSKLFLISKKQGNQTVQFAHIGTGNFNESTSRIYTDYSLLTCDPRITSEVDKVFQFFQVNYRTGVYRHLMVAPFYLRSRLEKLIDEEIMNAKKKKEAYIILKLNSIEDSEMIDRLYAASKAGVKIKLLIRGVCSLIPGVKGLSENIEAYSIVDRFLEHNRVYIFANGGDEKIYISSADLMTRNLDARTEVACPIFDESIKKEIKNHIDLQFKDNVKARVLDKNMSNTYKKSKSKPIHSQLEIYNHFQHKLGNK